MEDIVKQKEVTFEEFVEDAVKHSDSTSAGGRFWVSINIGELTADTWYDGFEIAGLDNLKINYGENKDGIGFGNNRISHYSTHAFPKNIVSKITKHYSDNDVEDEDEEYEDEDNNTIYYINTTMGLTYRIVFE